MITLEYYTSIEQISKEEWTLASSPQDVFLQYDYLSFLEKFPPIGLSFAYVIYYSDHKPVGAAYFQISGFDVSKSLSGYFSKGKLPAFSEALAKSLKFNSLVSGNLLLTGEHGFYFKPVVESQRQLLMMKAIRTVRTRIKKEGRGATLNFVKDFHLEQDQFLKKQCGEFDFHPNMILDIHKDWSIFEDYLDSMTTKYRTRAKRAFKKLEPVKLVKLSLQDMEVLNVRIYQLYARIAKNVGFNLVELHPNYFLEIKRIFGDKYEVWGAFDGEQLIGFYTTMHNYDELETGFLGFDDAYNPTHQLYLNFLYSMVKQGIEKKVSRIVFARTAMEIKSSIGAEPVKMHTYIKHQSKVVNAMLPHLVKWLSPPQDWVQRKPFKHQAED
ncbi:MAG: hypothetical protein ACOYOA_04295 [Saprospiraceae bacterium]